MTTPALPFIVCAKIILGTNSKNDKGSNFIVLQKKRGELISTPQLYLNKRD